MPSSQVCICWRPRLVPPERQAAAEGSSWALQLPEVEKLVQQAGFSEAGSAEAGGPTEAGGLAEVPAGSAEAGGTAEAGTAEAGGPAEVPAGSAEAGGLAGSADAGGAAEEAGGLAEPAEAGSAEALAAACGKLEEVETMLAQETGMNPNVILKNLTDIAPLWPSVESPELKDRMVAAFSTLKTRMSAACAAASKEDQEAKLKACPKSALRLRNVIGFCAICALQSFEDHIKRSMAGRPNLAPEMVRLSLLSRTRWMKRRGTPLLTKRNKAVPGFCKLQPFLRS